MKTRSIIRFMTLILIVVLIMTSFTACGTTSTTKVTTATSQSTNTSTASPASTTKATTAKAEPIYIAVVGPMTGDNQQYGIAFKNAADMVVERVSKSGGINGSSLIVDYFDDRNDTKENVIIASKIVSEKKYIAVVGSQTSGCSMAMAPILQKAGIIQFTPISSHPDLTSIGEYIFSMNYTTKYASPVWADLFVDHYHAKKPGVIYVNTDYGNTTYTLTKERLQKYKLDYVVAESYVPNSIKDYTSILTKIKDSKCDLLSVRGPYSDTAQIVLQAKQLNLNIPITIDGMSGNSEFLKIAGDAAEGIIYVDTMFLSNTEEPFYSFSKEYEARYKKIVDNYSTQTYDVMNLLVDALKKHGTNVKAVRDELAATKGYKGVCGIVNMGSTRNRDAVFYIIQVQKGTFVKIGSLDKKPDNFVFPDLSK